MFLFSRHFSESERRNGIGSSGVTPTSGSDRTTPSPSSSGQPRLNVEGLPEGWTMQVRPFNYLTVLIN